MKHDDRAKAAVTLADQNHRVLLNRWVVIEEPEHDAQHLGRIDQHIEVPLHVFLSAGPSVFRVPDDAVRKARLPRVDIEKIAETGPRARTRPKVDAAIEPRVDAQRAGAAGHENPGRRGARPSVEED